MNRRLLLTAIVCGLYLIVVIVVMRHKDVWMKSQTLGTVPPPITMIPMAYLPYVQSGVNPTPVPTPLPIPARRGISVFLPGDETTLNADWYYSWTHVGSDIGPAKFVPMFRPNTIASASAYSLTLAGQYVLAFNEPDACPVSAGSDCLTVSQLVEQWHELELSLPDSLLVGPGLTNHCYGAGCWSLAEFLDAYHTRYGVNPRIDSLGLHYYHYFSYNPNVADNTLTQPYRRTWNAWLTYMKQTLTAHGYGPIPIWLSEFGYQPACGNGYNWCPTASGVATGLAQYKTLIAQEPRIERYNWYCARLELSMMTDPVWWPMSLINVTGLTVAGQVYRND